MNPLPRDPACVTEAEVRCSARLQNAFQELLNAFDYATSLDVCPWEFAVELTTLRRLNVSNNDLRFLVASGLVNHAIETTTVADAERSFKWPAALTLCDEACFVLTAKGTAACHAIWTPEKAILESHDVAASQPGPLDSVTDTSALPAPSWDNTRQELRVGSVVIKRFRVPAVSQETILAAFEEEAWPPRIDDPLPPRSDQPSKRRLQDTIKSLNRNQKHHLIRFLGDGSAQGVLWEYCVAPEVLLRA